MKAYKCLGHHLDNRLDWRQSVNSKAAGKKKRQRRFYFLSFFGVCNKILQISTSLL